MYRNSLHLDNRVRHLLPVCDSISARQRQVSYIQENLILSGSQTCERLHEKRDVEMKRCPLSIVFQDKLFQDRRLRSVSKRRRRRRRTGGNTASRGHTGPTFTVAVRQMHTHPAAGIARSEAQYFESNP